VPVLLELKSVSKTYGQWPTAVVALDRIVMSVSAGELLAVTGRSGSGKTTFSTWRVASTP
jgi:ABC-type lipoprotein export system ATPase subunit